jgi:AraC-like DNA-binding protein
MAYDLLGLFSLICERLNSSPGLSSKTLSSQIGIERHTIERTIKSKSGMTFRQFRCQITLERIKVLMRTRPDLTVKELAGELNYRSQSAFSRFVRENTGCSPSKLRHTVILETSTLTGFSRAAGI